MNTRVETSKQLHFFSPPSLHHNPLATTSENNFKNGVYEQIHSHFVEQDADEKNITFVRDILGSEAECMSDNEIYAYITEIQYLAEQWLDEFESTIFAGTTLRELLGTG